MKSDSLAGAITFFLAAIKLVMLNSNGAIPAASFLFVAVWALCFYTGMCPISEAISGGEYLRNWTRSRSWQPENYSRKQDPFEYYLNLTIAIIFATFSFVCLFTVD